MTRTDSVVSSGPRTAGASSFNGKFSRRPRRLRRRGIALRWLLALPLALALMVPAGTAIAQGSSGTSGYKQEPPKPKTSTEPKSGTAPAKAKTTPTTTTTPKPAVEPAPAKAAATPTESKLPFTGLDLRWIVGAGLLLIAAGLTLRFAAARRQRHENGS
jgi:hypothetical protein